MGAGVGTPNLAAKLCSCIFDDALPNPALPQVCDAFMRPASTDGIPVRGPVIPRIESASIFAAPMDDSPATPWSTPALIPKLASGSVRPENNEGSKAPAKLSGRFNPKPTGAMLLPREERKRLGSIPLRRLPVWAPRWLDTVAWAAWGCWWTPLTPEWDRSCRFLASRACFASALFLLAAMLCSNSSSSFCSFVRRSFASCGSSSLLLCS